MGSGFNKKKHKYFIVSDIHGNYDELLSSLEEKKFDPKNPKHILISLGDAIDRGPKNKEVITFLNNLSHKILIRGNHEDLFQDLINRNGIPLPNDISNKTIETFLELHNLEIKDLDLIIEGKMTLPKINEEWIKYNKSCIDYYETNQYIFVHGWIPINEDKMVTMPSGIAHFLEHKLFEQEDGESVHDFYNKTGTYVNAATDYKTTKYYFVGVNNFYNNLNYLLDFVGSPYFTDENVL